MFRSVRAGRFAPALVLLATGCAGIPEDELARLAALEADWSRPVELHDGPLALATLQEAAIRLHPGLRATLHRYQAALRQILLDGALEDPRVQFGYFLETMESPMPTEQWRAGVSQTFPFWGKRDLMAELALHEAQELREALVEQRLAIARDVATAWWELFYLAGMEDVTRRQLTLLDGLVESVESRFLAGRAPRADLVSILMEMDRQQTQLAIVAHRVVVATARLNALLDRPTVEPLALDLPEPATLTMPDLDPTALLERAQEFGPVRAHAHRILRQEAAVALARLGWFPDVSVGLDYMGVRAPSSSGDMPPAGDGTDPVVLGVGFNLPIWWRKNLARVERAAELLEAERASRRALIRDAERQAVAALEAAAIAEANRVLFLEQLVPKATERLELSEQDYAGGRVDLDRLIGAERELLELRLRGLESIADREAALAELDYLTAGGLGRLPRARPAGAEDVAEVDALAADGRSTTEEGSAP